MFDRNSPIQMRRKSRNCSAARAVPGRGPAVLLDGVLLDGVLLDGVLDGVPVMGADSLLVGWWGD
jgi:hypothetical protein